MLIDKLLIMTIAGMLIISVYFAKITRMTGFSKWSRFILSLSSGWILALTTISVSLFLRSLLPFPVVMMYVSVVLAFVAFISFQIFLYHEDGEKRN
ncbi:hypothetical protein [Salimicrobium halophilum]|uniref:Uncharacterized protein n=1 Tax=Salimicrobium halophilum TaxID=86666 RepID=A0A1G8R994_9BACI|nr:hypothetical protein [Salimicrobium halophilum]SDJ13499.1 hypothetical protein SAMN04490247_0901 [Salimicrobium halophilum]